MSDPLKAPLSKRGRHRDRLQDGFEATAVRLATMLERSGDVRAWQAGMSTAIQEHMAQQAALGLGRMPKRAEVKRIAEGMVEQTAYLSKFADEVAAKRLVGRPMSSAGIAARAAQYSGAGRALWYEMAERESENDVIYVYRARDDGRACDRCLEAARNSPYLPGQGAMPGSICRGHGRCRCTREIRHDKRVAKELRKAG